MNVLNFPCWANRGVKQVRQHVPEQLDLTFCFGSDGIDHFGMMVRDSFLDEEAVQLVIGSHQLNTHARQTTARWHYEVRDKTLSNLGKEPDLND